MTRFDRYAHEPKRIGWLLASLTQSNIAKGERLLAEVSPTAIAKARTHARQLISIYIANGSDQNTAAYAEHPYA